MNDVSPLTSTQGTELDVNTVNDSSVNNALPKRTSDGVPENVSAVLVASSMNVKRFAEAS